MDSAERKFVMLYASKTETTRTVINYHLLFLNKNLGHEVYNMIII